MKPCWVEQSRSSFLLSLSFFLLAWSACSGAAPQSTSITHQAHSFDDLGEWRQLIAKGTNSIKVDLHYVLPPMCAVQPRVLNHDTRGCYLLSHDAPRADEVYYTITDLITFVVDPNNAYLFSRLPQFYLYLAFKNSRDRFPAANITQSNNLQIELITLFSEKIYSSSLYNIIKLVYDGTYYNPQGRQYAWPRTYNFAASDIDDPSSCLYSYDGYKCRNTAVINTMANPLPFVDPALAINRMCKVGFGKFKEEPYPMVFFEPTDQRSVLQILDTYLNCSIEHTPGFAIAINTDPVQYEVYAGTRSGKAWNEEMFDRAKWAQVVPLTSNTGGSAEVAFLTFYLGEHDQLFYAAARGAFDTKSGKTTFPFGQIGLEGDVRPLGFPFSVSAEQKLNTFAFEAGSATYIFVCDHRGVFGIYEFAAPATLHLVTSSFLAYKRSQNVALISSSVLIDNEWIEVQFLQGYTSSENDAKCSLLIQWWKLRFDLSLLNSPDLLPVGQPFCAAVSSPTNPFLIDSASFSVVPITAASQQINRQICRNSTHSGILIVSSRKTIFGGILCANAHTSTLFVCTDRSCLAPRLTASDPELAESSEPRAADPYDAQPHITSNARPALISLDVGTSPSVTLAQLPDGEPVVLEVHGDGHCYNSDWNNKRAYPRVCKSTPISSRYVLNYNYGRLSDWATHIYDQKGMISSCDGFIFHGVYDEGSLPSAFLAMDQNKNFRMIAAHTGFPENTVDYAGCSWPVPYNGAIIDGISLPSLSLMKGEWVPPAALLAGLTPPNLTEILHVVPVEMTISSVLCDACKERMMTWQSSYQYDYDLVRRLTLKVANMCTLGRLVAGDGSLSGCVNLVVLYVPSLMVDLIGDVFSPDNCNVLSFCSTNSTVDVLPDPTKQEAKVSRPYPALPSSNSSDVVQLPTNKIMGAGTADESNDVSNTQSDDASDETGMEREQREQAEKDLGAETEARAAIYAVVKETLYEMVGL